MVNRTTVIFAHVLLAVGPVCCHEESHGFTIRRHGRKVVGIDLIASGGALEPNDEQYMDMVSAASSDLRANHGDLVIFDAEENLPIDADDKNVPTERAEQSCGQISLPSDLLGKCPQTTPMSWDACGGPLIPGKKAIDVWTAQRLFPEYLEQNGAEHVLKVEACQEISDEGPAVGELWEGVRVKNPSTGEVAELVRALRNEKLVAATKQRAGSVSISVVALESTSRVRFKANMGSTRSLLENMAASKTGPVRVFPFPRFHASQPGSTSDNMTPMFSGHPYNRDLLETERTATRVYADSEIPDEHWVWQEASKRGYITMYSNTYCNHLFGCGEAPGVREFDHMMPILPATCDPVALGDTDCHGDLSYMDHTMRYRQMFHDAYGEPDDPPQFSYVHLSAAHESDEPLKAYDKTMPAELRAWFDSSAANRTVLFFMGDHGRSTIPEENASPILYLAVPRVLLDEVTGAEAALEANQDAMVSHFDLHQTMRHIIALSASPDAKEPEPFVVKGRSSPAFKPSSLLTMLPADRGCEESGVDENFADCSSEEWEEVPATEAVLTAVRQKLAESAGGVEGCAELEVHAVVSSERRSGFWRLVVQVMPGELEFAVNVEDSEDKCSVSLLKQNTRYHKYEQCTPQGAAAEFCVC